MASVTKEQRSSETCPHEHGACFVGQAKERGKVLAYGIPHFRGLVHGQELLEVASECG